jgi:hypothetical protein
MRSKLSGTSVVTHVRRVGGYIVLRIGGFVVLPVSGELIYGACVVSNGSPRSVVGFSAREKMIARHANVEIFKVRQFNRPVRS